MTMKIRARPIKSQWPFIRASLLTAIILTRSRDNKCLSDGSLWRTMHQRLAIHYVVTLQSEASLTGVELEASVSNLRMLWKSSHRVSKTRLIVKCRSRLQGLNLRPSLSVVSNPKGATREASKLKSSQSRARERLKALLARHVRCKINSGIQDYSWRSNRTKAPKKAARLEAWSPVDASLRKD